jgi:DNA-binding CsgD family transcriptional regulator
MGTRKKKKGRSGAQRTGKLLTLGEVARRAGVSIPTAQSYKRKYQARLPSVGTGRKQRYKPDAITVFKKLREENAQRRGGRRGPSTASGGSERVAGGGASGAADRSGALSLAEIGRRTKISYPTLLRYLQIHSRTIPSIGTGRTRRFPASAVQVFERLRGQSRGGRRRAGDSGHRSAVGADSALTARIRKIESMQAEVSRQLSDVIRVLKQPLQVTIRPH